MLNHITRLVLVVFVLLALAAPVAAQDEPTPLQPMRIETLGTDSHTLVGTYFLPPGFSAESDAPAVLLLHMLNSNKEAWTTSPDLVAGLLDAGYYVLAVDMRGHGETGGEADWQQAETDVQSWISWLRNQPGVDRDRINLVGGSIGSNLALRGMMNDSMVMTAVALSPGRNYHGVSTEDVMAELRSRPVMLVSALGDGQSITAVRTLINEARSGSLLQLYSGSRHGTSLLMSEPSLAPLIIFWLETQNR